MISNEQLLLDHKKHPFLWMGVFSLGVSIVLAKLNIYLGTQVNYLDYLSLFNALTIVMLTCVSIVHCLKRCGLVEGTLQEHTASVDGPGILYFFDHVAPDQLK